MSLGNSCSLQGSLFVSVARIWFVELVLVARIWFVELVLVARIWFVEVVVTARSVWGAHFVVRLGCLLVLAGSHFE